MSKCTPCDINTDSLFDQNAAKVNQGLVGVDSNGELGADQALVYVKPNGEFSVDQINLLVNDFRESVTRAAAENDLESITRRFGQQAINDSAKEVQSFLNSDTIDLTDYPELKDRIDTGFPITNVEIAEFCNSNILTPAKITNLIANSSGKFLDEFNCFFMGSSMSKVMGGFCSTLKNVHGAVNGFFNLIGAVGALINNALDALSKLQNLEDEIKTIFDKIKIRALIESIKDKIVLAIKMHLRCVIDAVTNFVGIFDELNEMGQRVNPKLIERAQELKDDVNQKFSPENQESILRKIEQGIDYAINRFANPTLAQIESLAFRICGMASAIEELITDQKLPLDRFAEKIADAHERAKNNSAPAKAEAIRAGAIRLSDEQRQEEINNIVDRCREASERANELEDADPDAFDPRNKGANTPMIMPKDLEGLPTYEDIYPNGNGRFKLAYGFRPQERNMDGSLKLSDAGKPVGGMGSEGWYGLSPKAKIRLNHLQELLGFELEIRSGYRSPEYNAATPGAAKSSYHIERKALDITWAGYNLGDGPTGVESVIQVAERKAGWVRFGVYSDFLHIDLGPITGNYGYRWGLRGAMPRSN